MNAPRFSQGAALLYWGWQVELLAYAVPMALLLELQHFTRRRWNLDKSELYRVADLTTVILVGLIIYLATSVPLSHFLLSLVELTPALFFPLVLILAFSTWEKMPLDVLFYSLRRQPTEQAEWDLQLLFIGICLVATGTSTEGLHSYLPVCAVIICWCLWPARPRRYTTSFSILVLLLMFGAATASHTGLHQAHLLVKERTTAWLADLMNSRRDPFRASTAIGSVGRLKLSSAIVLRVQQESRRDGLLYLQEASYDWLSGEEWMAMQRTFQPLDKIDQFSWELPQVAGRGESSELNSIRIYQDYAQDRGLLPLPPGSRIIESYPALQLMLNRYQSVQATGIMSPPAFRVIYERGQRRFGQLEAADLRVPDEFASLTESELATVIGEEVTQEQAVARIRSYFEPFKYTLYQPDEILQQNPLTYFLQERRAGHCEFFATATVLLLRQAGIPARYAVGYVVDEFDPLTGMYLVRKSHAHAWAVAYLQGSWQVVDTTPSTWLAIEESAYSPLRPLADLVSNLAFRFALWREAQRMEDYTYWLYGIAFLLTLFLIYRLSRGEQVMMAQSRGNGGTDRHPAGGESPFYLVEYYLRDRGQFRQQGEPLLHWIRRIGRVELAPLVTEHYAWRFDPRGITDDRQQALDRAVHTWLEQDKIRSSE